MRSIGIAIALAVASVGAVGCEHDDTVFAPDAAPPSGDGSVADGTTSDVVPRSEAGTDAALDAPVMIGDAGPRLLITYGTSSSQLYAVDVAGKSVAGTLDFPGGYGIPFTQPSAPFLLEQAVDVVAKLDPASPWIVDSTWNVALNDNQSDAAVDAIADPVAAIVTAANKTYVLRYTRNEIAVLDESQNVDGGAPTKTVDLSSLVQTGDSDGIVEMTAGVYVAATHLLFVVLGNIDRNLVLVSPGAAVLLCPTSSASVIAIDTTTDAVVSLGGTMPGGGIALVGVDPIPGGVAYDAPGSRLLIDSSGCNVADAQADGGVGALTGRRIEALSLMNGATPALLHDGTNDGFPSALVYIDSTHAVLGYDFFGGETTAWDPTQTTLGMVIPNAPDAFVYDGAGNLLGTRETFLSDGGSTNDVVQVQISTGNSTTLVSNPFTPGGFVGGVDLWPHP